MTYFPVFIELFSNSRLSALIMYVNFANIVNGIHDLSVKDVYKMRVLLQKFNSLKSLVIIIVLLVFLSVCIIGILFASASLTTTRYRNNAYDIRANSYLTEMNDLVKRYSTAMHVAALNPTIRENIFREGVSSSEMIKLSPQMEKAVIASTYLLIDQENLRRHIFYSYLPTDGKYFFSHDVMAQQSWYPDYIKDGSTEYCSFVYDAIASEYHFLMLQVINDFNVTTSSTRQGAECYEIIRMQLKSFFDQDPSAGADIKAYPFLFSQADDQLVYTGNSQLAQDAQYVYEAAVSGSLENIQNYCWDKQLSSGYIPTVVEVPSMKARLVILFEAQPFGRYLSDQSMLISALFLMGLLVFMLMVLIVFYMHFKKRINHVVYLLDSFDGGNSLSPVPVTDSADEIGKIQRHTLQMQSRLQTLIEEEYKVKLQNISAQYEVLTAYINPHFLYNTLNSIAAMASMEGAEDTGEMVLALSNMFRYSADMHRHQVRLSDELKNVNDYLYIQGIRYKTSFVFRVDVPEQLKDCKVPKLILQSVVENCFKHGFEVKGGARQTKEIILSAVREGAFLKIYVMDNGKGISPEKLQYLNMILAGETYTDRDNNNTEIGLSNVNRRLKLVYGDECGLQISCEEGKYTCVKLLLRYESYKEVL